MCYISAMFLLFLNIDHLKLIKRNTSFSVNNLLNSVRDTVRKWGGVTSNISPYLSSHPDGYEHSKEWFIHCINEIEKYLRSCSELVGYTLLISKDNNYEEDEIFDKFKTMNFGVFSVNGVWGQRDVVKELNIFDTNKVSELYKINTPINVEDKWDKINKLSDSDIIRIDSGRFELKKIVDYQTCNSLVKWAVDYNIEKFLYFNYENNFVAKIKFIKYMITKESDFNPLTDLDEIEKANWGMYLELYRSMQSRDISSYVLDSPGFHLNKLINFWLESYCARYKTLLLIKSSDNIDSNKDFSASKLLLVSAKNSSTSIHEAMYYIDQLAPKVLRILYYALITEGFLIIDELVYILERCGFNRIYIVDTIEYFRIKGFFWGDEILYANDNRLLPYIVGKSQLEIKSWHCDLISSLTNLGEDILIKRLLVEKSDDSDKLDSNIVINYIDTFINMGVIVDNSNKLSPAMAMYHNKRVSRVINKNFIEIIDKNSLELSYLYIQDRWTKASMNGLVVDSKKIYIKYQQLGDMYNECRSKILFSLCLMADGRIDEAVDYLELNSTYSLTINDRYSYIRSNCFLMCAMLNKGNLTGVLRVFNNISKWNWIGLKTKWYIYSLFIASRSYCELGKYKEALTLIKIAAEEADDKKYKEIQRVLYNWQSLYFFYDNQLKKAFESIHKMELSKESYLFLSKMEYINCDFEKARIYIEKAKLLVEDSFICDEDIIWKNGYFITEDFYLRGERESTINKEVDSFYFFICTLTECGDYSNDLLELIRKIPNDSLFVTDYKSLFYLYKLIIDNKINLDINKDKLIDKSVRLMQLRGNNIDSHNKKVHYYINFWNRIIMEYKR